MAGAPDAFCETCDEMDASGATAAAVDAERCDIRARQELQTDSGVVRAANGLEWPTVVCD